MIKLENVSKSFIPRQKVLSGINLHLKKGEWVWILGVTGIGKTVFMKTVYGEFVPDEGTVTVLGQNLASLNEKKLAKLRSRLGIITQEIRLFDSRTALENIYFILRALDYSRDESKNRADKYLKKVGAASYASKRAFELSVGQRQKIALARALAKEPEVLLLDEPFSALDEKERKEMLKLLGDINHQGTAILAVSHAHEVLQFLPGRVYQLKEEGLV